MGSGFANLGAIDVEIEQEGDIAGATLGVIQGWTSSSNYVRLVLRGGTDADGVPAIHTPTDIYLDIDNPEVISLFQQALDISDATSAIQVPFCGWCGKESLHDRMNCREVYVNSLREETGVYF